MKLGLGYYKINRQIKKLQIFKYGDCLPRIKSKVTDFYENIIIVSMLTYCGPFFVESYIYKGLKELKIFISALLED